MTNYWDPCTQGWGTGGNITAPLEAIAGVPATFGLDVGVEGIREKEGGVKRSYKIERGDGFRDPSEESEIRVVFK